MSNLVLPPGSPLPPPVPIARPGPAVFHGRPVVASDTGLVQRVGLRLLGLTSMVVFSSGLVALFVNQVVVDPYSSTPPSETFLRWTTWAFAVDEGSFGWNVTIALAPLGMLFALVLVWLGTCTTQDPRLLVLKARREQGAPRPTRLQLRALRPELDLVTERLASIRGTRSKVLMGRATTARVLLGLSMAGAALMAFLGWYAVSTDLPDRGLNAGVGPTVAIGAGTVAFVAAAMAMPWRRPRRFVFGPHGEVEEVGDDVVEARS